MPPELAHEIFILVHTCPDHDEETLISMLLVCKDWMSFLSSMPRIWHNLVRPRRQASTSTFLTRLSRTDSIPLCLRFRIHGADEDEDDISEYLPILENLSHRWESIHLTCDHIRPVMRLLRFTRHTQMPLLKKFEIDDAPGIVTLAQPQGLLAFTSALATLYIPSCHFKHFPRPETITTLIFAPCYVNFHLLRVVSQTHVRTLHMMRCIWDHLPLVPPWQFKHLRQLQVAFAPMECLDTFLSLISAPLLHTLAVRVELSADVILLSLADSLSFRPDMPNLTHLHLDIRSQDASESYLPAFLRTYGWAFPSVTDFRTNIPLHHMHSLYSPSSDLLSPIRCMEHGFFRPADDSVPPEIPQVTFPNLKNFISLDTFIYQYPGLPLAIVRGRIDIDHPLDCFGFDTNLLEADALLELADIVTVWELV
ncbi:hypothetical protein HWV62_42878 [Athelia sp. TMB]|nr:hypothetical protein HWV62_42878 [Athelia sp. TMB]